MEGAERCFEEGAAAPAYHELRKEERRNERRRAEGPRTTGVR